MLENGTWKHEGVTGSSNSSHIKTQVSRTKLFPLSNKLAHLQFQTSPGAVGHRFHTYRNTYSFANTEWEPTEQSLIQTYKGLMHQFLLNLRRG